MVVFLIAAPFLLSDKSNNDDPDGGIGGAGNRVVPFGEGLTGDIQSGGQFGMPMPPSDGRFRLASTPLNYQNAPSGIPVNRATDGNRIPATNPANLTGANNEIGNSRSWYSPSTGLIATPMEFKPFMNLAEVFDFGISPDWVKGRWKRVSTSPGCEGLHGLRVALVTGTNVWDLHGSLTYYFDKNQQCQRITFQGWTGDAAPMIRMLKEKHGFKAEATHSAGLYLRQSVWDTTGALLLKHPAVIHSDNPSQQLAIVFEMNDPKSRFEISEEFTLLIKGAQEAF